MDPLFMIDVALKSQQWEITKGHLRAMAAMQGSYQGGRHESRCETWETLQKMVEDFIEAVENGGLHE